MIRLYTLQSTLYPSFPYFPSVHENDQPVLHFSSFVCFFFLGEREEPERDQSGERNRLVGELDEVLGYKEMRDIRGMVGSIREL